MSVVYNGISDRPSLSRKLTDAPLIAYMDTTYPQRLPWRLWTRPSALVSMIAYVLQRSTLTRSSLLVDPPLSMGTGTSGMHSDGTWSLTPYLSCTGIQYLSLTTSHGNTGQVPSPPEELKYNPARLRTPCGRLARRLLLWGTDTPASKYKGNWTSGSASSSGAISRRTFNQDK